MRIKTTGEAMRDEVRFSSLFAQRANEQQPAERDGKPKLAPNGSPVHRTSLKALRLANGQVVGEERSVSLSIIDRTDIAAGKIYELVGTVWITPYLSNNGRLATSIVAESVREVSTGSPFPKINVGGGHNG